jgi:hypothetical protein
MMQYVPTIPCSSTNLFIVIYHKSKGVPGSACVHVVCCIHGRCMQALEACYLYGAMRSTMIFSVRRSAATSTARAHDKQTLGQFCKVQGSTQYEVIIRI